MLDASLLQDFTWENYKDISDSLVQFDQNNIDSEMERQASIYSYYHGLMSLAKRQVGEEQVNHDRIAGTVRSSCKSGATGKLTAKDLDDLVFSHPDYIESLRCVNDATFKYELLKGLVRSLEQKLTMMQQVSANRREETKLYRH